MGLNEQQLEAANCDDRLILCLASAGAGKTKTLITRVERLVNNGVNPRSILCLTFTNAAAFEMKNRYKQLPGLDLSKGVPEFRTFHGFCYSLIIKDKEVRERLGYTKVPEVCDDKQIKALKDKVKLQLNCKLSDAQLDNDVQLSRADQDEKDLFFKAFRKAIKKENIITFDMMCYNVCALFEKKDKCIEKYRDRYKHVIVDEFQDTDTRQFKFISSFPATTNVYLCGDALQCIYAFRGTTNEYVKMLSTAPGWKVIKLYKNYRSTRKICEFVNKFSKYASDDYRIPMEGQRDGGSVELIYGSYSSFNEPVDKIHLSILVDKLKENKVESAILCRTNKECGAVKAALTEAGIEFSSSNKSSDAINLLNSSLNNDYMLEWLTTFLEPNDYGDYIRLSAIEPNPDIRWFLSKYGSKDKVKKNANIIIKIRNITTSDKSQSEKFDAIVKLLKIKSKCELPDELMSNKQMVENLRDQLKDTEDNKIYVGTIHSSKGLEYDTVYVMGVDDGMFKLGTEEMNNLYYVAITRAKEHLVVFRR